MGTARDAAKYVPAMTDAMQEALEMDCVQTGTLLKDSGSVRSYYKDAGKIIGASRGGDACYIYAERAKTGEVHGRPMTVDELRKKGAQL